MKMIVGNDSVGLSLPFAAGVAAGVCLLGTLYSHPSTHFASASASLPLFLLLGVLVLRLRSRWLLGLLYFAAGLTVCLVSSLPSVRATLTEPGLFERCGTAFRRMLDGIPFERALTNAMVKAFLTGDQSDLPRHVRDAFRDSGASHLLALSGMHLSIIYLILSKTLSFLGNSPAMVRLRSVCIILLAAFFTLITGAVPSLVRAFLFISLRELSILSCRRMGNIRIFFTALMIQLAVSPDVATSVGFQLSYLAMLGIFLLYPPLDKLWEEISDGDEGILTATMHKIWSMTVLSVSCQITTAPVVLIYFGTFPTYFLVTNLLCIPLSNLIMIVSIAIMPLHALGICPAFLLKADDVLVESIVRILETISGIPDA